MCGIAGFFYLTDRGEPLSKDILIQMGESLRHRGPDDGGCYYEGFLGLTHRRLSIIDLSSAARQPMSDEEGRFTITFNGEVYNYESLRDELEAKGRRFCSASDTEVVLKAYMEWGPSALSHFIGMFAFAIWDSREKELFVARDRLGIKPLFYYSDGTRFAFASELKALLLLPFFSRALDMQALYQYLVFQYVPGPRTIYGCASKLRPGHYMLVREQGVETRCYWDIADPERVEKEARDERYCLERLRELLKDSIRLRQISDVPLGAFLSGGIDSSTVVALMQEESTIPVRTFSIGFDEASYNEAPYACKVAKYLGTEHHELYVTSREAFDLIPELTRYYDEPFSDSSAIPTFLVSSMARAHVTVCLSGDGGDELFCGYNRYAVMKRLRFIRSLPLCRDMLAHVERFPSWLLEGVGKAAKFLLFKDMKAGVTAQKIAAYSRVLRGDSLDTYRGLVQIFDPEAAAGLLGEGSFGLAQTDFYRAGKALAGVSEPERFSLVDIKTYLEGDILTKVDRASMAVGLEARVPLLDHRVVEFARTLPFAFKMRGRNSKYVLKKLLHSLVPEEFFRRPKQGFGIPVSQWLRGGLSHLVDEYLDSARIGKEGIFDGKQVSSYVEAHREGKEDHGYRLYNLLMFQMWYERYGIR